MNEDFDFIEVLQKLGEDKIINKCPFFDEPSGYGFVTMPILGKDQKSTISFSQILRKRYNRDTNECLDSIVSYKILPQKNSVLGNNVSVHGEYNSVSKKNNIEFLEFVPRNDMSIILGINDNSCDITSRLTCDNHGNSIVNNTSLYSHDDEDLRGSTDLFLANIMGCSPVELYVHKLKPLVAYLKGLKPQIKNYTIDDVALKNVLIAKELAKDFEYNSIDTTTYDQTANGSTYSMEYVDEKIGSEDNVSGVVEYLVKDKKGVVSSFSMYRNELPGFLVKVPQGYVGEEVDHIKQSIELSKRIEKINNGIKRIQNRDKEK